MASSNLSPQRTPRLSELEDAADETGRYLDLQLKIVREKTGETLLHVGGRWDRIDRKYVGNAQRAHVVYVNEAQVKPARALAAWLAKRLAGEEREVLHFLGVKRGGGKSHWCVLALVAVMIALPGALTWAVSPTHSRRDELERILRTQFPKTLGWWLWKGQPDYRFTFANGSALRLLSGEIPDSVRQGGAEVIFLNELQDMDRRVFSLGLPAVRNVEGRPAGIMLVAANPPTRSRGEHVNEIAEKLMSREIPGGEYFDVDPKHNTALEQKQLDVASRWVEAIDPTVAKADLAGEWLPVGDRAYPMWRAKDKFIDGEMRRGLVGTVPDIGLVDVTADLLKKIGAHRSSGREYKHVIVCDFQGRPHMAAIAGQVFRRHDGRLVFFVRHVFIAKGDELDLSDMIIESGLYSPDNAVMIGDASGDWQAGKDRKRNLPSFDAMKSQRWTIFPPREKQRADSQHASNPPVDVSLGQMFAVMRDDRLIVHPDCKWLIESLEKCPLRREGARPIIPAKGGYSHVTDCARYFVYRFEDRPKAPTVIPTPGSWGSYSKPSGIRTV